MSTLRILRYLRRMSLGYIIALVLVAAGAFAALLTTIEPDKKIRVGLLSYTEETNTVSSLQKLIDIKFDNDPAKDMLYRSAQADPSVQANQLESLAAEGCRVIIIDRNDFSKDEKSIIAVSAAGVKLLAINADIPGSNHTYLGTNPYDEGYLLGDYLHRSLPHQASIIYVTDSDSFFARQQLLGFSESCLLLRPDIRSITTGSSGRTVSGAVSAVNEILRKNPSLKVDAIIAPRLDIALATREAIIKSSRPAPLTYCISGSPAVTAAIDDGTIQASVGIDLNALADDAYRMADALSRGKTVDDKLYTPVLRTKETAH